MSNNDPQEVWQEESQQVPSTHFNGRKRIGLMPTEGHDAYKRSSARSSRRSRSERTSYLVATGHLDLEETKQLNSNKNSNKNKALIDENSLFKYNNGESLPLTISTQAIQHQQSQYLPGPSSGDQALRQYASSNRFDSHDNVLAHNSFKMSPHRSKSSSRQGNKDRGKFNQTYTEVTLPMKTSPAFDYILKDNKRRNRRCCLWLIYSAIVTICLAVIIFCSVQLLYGLRNQN